jgi:hypothetical protein
MARFITRIADLCRQRASDELFLRRFRMMRPGEDDDASGPGWYESSRELQLGLQVEEGRDDDGLLAEWHAALQRPGPTLRAATGAA